ncbi:MAG: cation transporter [Theionarchaea archaeon]|nr:cation transporter [Theionarchaea archaeon]
MFQEIRDMVHAWKTNPRKPLAEGSRFILMALRREGPLTMTDLEEKFFLFMSQFDFGHSHTRNHGHNGSFNITADLEALTQKGLVTLEQNTYRLTPKGEQIADETVKTIERGAEWVRTQFLTPYATARNTVFFDFFLAVLKLLAGMISGSVGLLADGADAVIDTVSAFMVWFGIRMNRELMGTVIIVGMMVVTGVSIGIESVMKLYTVITTTVEPVSNPFLVIGVESLALVIAGFLSFYQGYMGKKYGSLALVSQSIDSKNHIYVAAAVITGAFFSLMGIHFVDALVGIYISVKIVTDGIDLGREVISFAHGNQPDFSKYTYILEPFWKRTRMECMRTWMLYSLTPQSATREEIIHIMENTFQNTYVPIISEFGINGEELLDFSTRIDEFIEPLIEEELISCTEERFMVTEKGLKFIRSRVKNMRYFFGSGRTTQSGGSHLLKPYPFPLGLFHKG